MNPASQSPEYRAALKELNSLTATILGPEATRELQMIGVVELPCIHDLAPRRWQMPDGSIVGEADNREAVELLKNNPEEYFRRTAVWRRRVGADVTKSQVHDMNRCIPFIPFTRWGHKWDWKNSDDTNGTACCTSTIKVPCAKCGATKTYTVDG